MECTYPYLWIIPFITLPVTILLGGGLLLFPQPTRKLRRIWAFQNILVLCVVMVFSIGFLIHQINGSSPYHSVWSWTINNDFSLEFGLLIDSLSSILLILISTVGILVLFYSDNYMSHDQGYLRFFAYMSFFNTSMLGLVTSSNWIQIYIFWELVGMCSYLLIGFWFTRPIASDACQKAFVTNRVGDFGLLLGILGLYWLTGSLEFQDLFAIVNNLIYNNEVNVLFLFFCTSLVFLGAVTKSAQFPLHIWLPDAMEGPTPISALIHAATMVAAGIFLVARLLPLFKVIPYLMNLIAFIGIITVLLGATLALAQKDIKRSLAYSTMSQLGYMMLALGIGSYRAALFHLITHAYSKALLFLGSGSIIHSMEALVGYSPNKSQNLSLMGGLIKHVPITRISFLLGTLSLCGIPPLACFWSKDDILNDSLVYSPSFAIIAYFTAGLTAFYMLRVYLLTFEGHLNVHFQNYSGKTNNFFYSICLWGKEEKKMLNINKRFLFPLLIMEKKNQGGSFFPRKTYPSDRSLINGIRLLIRIQFFPTKTKRGFSYPDESDNTMLFPMLVLVLFTLFIGLIGIPLNQFNLVNLEGIQLDILSKLFIPSLNLFHQRSNYSFDWYEFFRNSTFSVIIACFGIFIACSFYNPIYSSLQNFDFFNFLATKGPKRLIKDKIITVLYDWSYNRGYIDAFYTISFIKGVRRIGEIISFWDRRVIDGIINGIGVGSFVFGESIKYVGGGRISSYLFLFLFYIFLFILLVIYYFIFLK